MSLAFFVKEFNFQSSVFNGCHDVWMLISIDTNSIAILNIHSFAIYYIIFGITKSEAINLVKKMLYWDKKVGHYKK